MRSASGGMLCRRSFRREVASGPYCVSRSSRRMTVAVTCLIWFVFWSNVVFADAINRPSTSAVSVPIRPAVSFTTSLESECKWCSDNNGRTAIQPGRRPISARTQATKSIDSSYLRMLLPLGDYADPRSDFAGLSKDPFLRPSSTRTGRGAYVAYGSWLRDNALMQFATVHDPVNVVRHGRSE